MRATGRLGGIAAGIALAAAAWWWFSGEDPSPPTAPAERAVSGEAVPGETARGLAGAPEGATAQAPEVVAEVSASVPLDTPIPSGKGSVAGVLRFSDGTPVAGVRLALSGSPAVEVTTDAEGRFHIHGEWVRGRDLNLKGPRQYTLSLVGVALQADARVFVEVVVDRGVPLVGTVLSARTRAPIPGARVILRRPGAHSDNTMQAGFGMVETDEAGAFRFEWLPRGAYTLAVTAEGHEARDLAFDAGADATPMEVVLEPARILVLRFQGLPAAAAGAKVAWMLQRSGAGATPSGRSVLDERGEVRLAAPPPGQWTLTIFEGGVLPRIERGVDVPPRDAADAPLEVAIELPAGGRLAGVVRDAAGEPLGGLVTLPSGLRSTTDAEGRYAFPWAPAGEHPLWFGGGPGKVLLGSARVKAGEDAWVDLRGGPAGLDLRVVAEGAPLTEGVAWLARDPGGEIVAEGRPGSDGRVSIRHLSAGEYRLSAMGGRRPVLERRVTLGAGTLDLGDVVFPEAVPVRLDLVLPMGQTRPESVFARVGSAAGVDPRLNAMARVDVDGDGVWWLRGLAVGTYEVTFSVPGLPSVTTTVVVREDATAPQRVVFPAR